MWQILVHHLKILIIYSSYFYLFHEGKIINTITFLIKILVFRLVCVYVCVYVCVCVCVYVRVCVCVCVCVCLCVFISFHRRGFS